MKTSATQFCLNISVRDLYLASSLLAKALKQLDSADDMATAIIAIDIQKAPLLVISFQSNVLICSSIELPNTRHFYASFSFSDSRILRATSKSAFFPGSLPFSA